MKNRLIWISRRHHQLLNIKNTMTILLIILAVPLSIIAIVLVAGVFIKKDFTIEKDIIVLKPASEVFDYIRLQKNQSNYNKWWMIDPDSKKEYRGTDGTVGFVAAWDSDNRQAGKGEQEIKRIDDQQIDCEIRFERPFRGVSYTTMTASPAGTNQTNVMWTFKGENKFPLNAVFAIFGLQKALAKDLQLSLENLRNIVEH